MKDWTPTQDAFRRLLEWLDEGLDSGGQRYLDLRSRLVRYFDRRHCAAPDDLADETINRVARRLQEEGQITDTTPAQYCYIVAKYVFLEYTRRARTEAAASRASSATGEMASDASHEAQQKRFECLEECLGKLPESDRHLILEYYSGDQREKIDRRKALALQLSLSANALTVRACRVRQKVETCVKGCVAS